MTIRKKLPWTCPTGLTLYAALADWVRTAEDEDWTESEIQTVMDEVVEAADEAAGLAVLAWYSRAA